MSGIDIGEILGRAMMGGNPTITVEKKVKKTWDVDILPEAQKMELERLYRDYKTRGRFKAGDLVTARSISGTKGAGQPFIVLEVRDNAECSFDGGDDASDSRFGLRLDIRVMTFVENECIRCYWGESWEYEPYDPD